MAENFGIYAEGTHLRVEHVESLPAAVPVAAGFENRDEAWDWAQLHIFEVDGELEIEEDNVHRPCHRVL